jgi:hypothetical protein
MPYLNQRNVLQQLFNSKSGTLDYKFEVCIVVVELGSKQLSVNNEQRLYLTKYSI